MKYLFSFCCYFLTIAWASASEIGCDSHATIFRRYERGGFHLTVESVIELVVDVAKNWDNCTLALKESISDSFYVDPDQLSELRRSGLCRSCVVDKINIEAPQISSRSHTVYFYGKFKRSQNLIHSKIKYPLHLRYHPPVGHTGFAQARPHPPVLLVSCPHVNCFKLTKNKAPCYEWCTDMCTWTRFPYKTNSDNVTFSVPVGNVLHLWFVYPTTLIITLGSCFYIILIIVLSTNKK